MAKKKEPVVDPIAGMGKTLRDVKKHLENGTTPGDGIDVDFKDDDLYTEDDRKSFESGKKVMESSADGFSGSDMRMGMGLFYTKDEWEKKRVKILKDQLP